MRRHVYGLLAVGIFTASVVPMNAQAPQQPPPPAVKVGQPAPDFTLPYLAPVADGKVEPKQVKLSDYKGKQNVVLAFFPAAFSPG
jgi:hypothetical protein